MLTNDSGLNKEPTMKSPIVLPEQRRIFDPHCVRVDGPAMSFDASGSLGGVVTFSKWKGRNVLKRKSQPSNPKSGLQVGMRSVFRYQSQAWAALSAANKALWDDLAAASNITNLNAQIAFNGDRARRDLGIALGPAEAAGTTPDAPTGGAATAGVKSLTLNWTRPAANKGDYVTYIYMSTTTGFTPGIGNLIRVLDVAAVTHTVTGLTTGTAYYFDVRESNTDGEYGALNGEFTGTPD